MNRRLLFAPAFLLLVPGCFGAEALQQVSSGYTGCSSDEILITNDNASVFNQRSWDASCRGRVFHCSAVAKGGMSCVEDRGATTATTAAVAPTDGKRPGVAATGPRMHSWQRFTAKDCGVSIDLPGTPEERRPLTRTKAAKQPSSYSATVELDEGSVAIGCRSWPEGASEDAAAIDAIRDEALRALGASFNFDADGIQGRETQFVVDDQHGRLRIVTHDRQIITMTLVPTHAFSKREAARFFSSVAYEAPTTPGSIAKATSP